MTMRSCSVFLAIIFACISNAVLATNIIQSSADGIHPRFLSHIQKRSTLAEGQKACFENLISKKSSLLIDFQNQLKSCAENAKTVDYYTLMKAYAIKKVDKIKEALIKCDLKEDASYIECLKDFDIDSREYLDEIREKIEDSEYNMKAQKEEEQECYKNSAVETEQKYTTSLSELEHCLSKDAALPKPQTKLDQVKEIYRTLQSCTKKDISLFHNCLIESFADKDLKIHFYKNAAKYYEELKDFDNAENTCLRHFITKFIHDDFTKQFDLSKCVIRGLDKAAGKEEGDTKVIENYGKFHKLLLSCRVESDSLAIGMCISNMIQNSKEVDDITWDSHRMSDSYLQKLRDQIYSTFNNEDTCMGYIFDRLQYKGLFLKDPAIRSMQECIDSRYRLNTTPVTTEDVLTKLSVMEEALIMCSHSAITAVFTECSNTYLSQNLGSLKYIVNSPLFDEKYLQGITKHDKVKGTCYAKIVNGHTANDFAPVVKCIGDRVFYRPNSNAE